MNAENILTIGIDYRSVHGGVAAVENVYSTFYKPFNHITTVVDGVQVNKLFILCSAFFQFFGWMLFRPQIKIVHVHGASNASFWLIRIFIYIAKLFGKKVIFHCHGAEFQLFTARHRKAVIRTLNKCDCIIALSKSWKLWFENTIHHKNVVVIKNVIAPPHINKKKNDKFVILFFGRLGKRKGIYDILDVLSEHREEFINKLEFLFGGDGDVEQVQAIIRERNLNDIAKYHGWVSGIKKERLLNQADAYILPSYNEGLPISVLEAMSYSLPIISTTVGGIPEILKNNENGFIMEPGDKIAIYHAISKLMANEAMTKRMGENSLNKVQEHLPDYVARQLQTLYDSLV